MSDLGDVLDQLAATVAAREGDDPGQSYTAKLLAGGPALFAKKFGEEAVEVVIAAVSKRPANVVSESADMLYHWLVVLQGSGVSLEEVAAVLRARQGIGGLAEKAAR